MIAIYYIVFVLLALIFLKHIYSFLKYFYSRPLLINTYAEFIPSKSIINDYIIENKEGSYSAIIELKGFSYFKAENLEKSAKENLKIKERALNFNDLKENIHIKFLFKRFKIQDGYSNKNYIEVTSNSKIHLKENSNRLLSSLSEFKPKLLENKELLDFLFFNCNLVEKSLKIDEKININDICSYSNIEFSNDCGELRNIDTKKYFKCFSFNFGSNIDNAYFSKMITSNIQFDFIINTKFFDKLTAQSAISENKKNISASNDASKEDGMMSRFFNSSNKKIQEIAEAQEIIRNEESNLTVCDTFIIVFADSEEELELSSTKLKELISKYEIFLVEEVKLLNFFFLQRLIGFKLHHTMKFLIPYADTLIYAKQVLSNTIAGLFDYIDMPTGLSKCDWGDKPISSFPTNYNNLYNFYTHVSEEKAAVGHGVIMADTGTGKTTFVQYLMKGILDSYKDVDVYSFDRNNGISVFTNWVGGKDINFLEQAINPLQVDLEQEDNKEFLYNFLSMIAKVEKTEEKTNLKKFIDEISFFPPKTRVLKELIENDAISPSLKEKLEPWTNGNYAKYINAPEDTFNLDAKMLNFQMDKILDDEELSAPIIYYIMFKIRQKAKTGEFDANGNLISGGHFIFIDESAKMLKNPYFQYQIEILIDEHRKLGGAVWLAFQHPDYFLKDENLKGRILGQCKNQMLFASDGIKDETLENLNINKSIYNELLEVQKTIHNNRFVLLKRPQENVILNVNLKDKLGDNLKFLSSSKDDVNRMNLLIEKYGSAWREYF